MIGQLVLLFGQLSLLAVGGVNSVVPEMQRQVVQSHHWMDARDFAALFALAQAAPGPNMLVATLVGWRVAGVPGALSATAALCLPSCLLTFLTAAAWHRFREARWRRVVQAGLTPVTVGLVVAAGALLARATSLDARTALVTGVVTLGVLSGRVHPLLLLGAGAALGAAGVL